MILQNKKVKKIKLYLHFVNILCGEAYLKHSDTTHQKINYPMDMSNFILFIYLFKFLNVPIYVSVFI